MAIDQEQCVKIAYLYHQDDDTIFKSLSKHLVGLRRDKLITEWFETLAGTTIQERIKHELESSQVIILLISSSFEADDNYSGSEMVDYIKSCAEKGIRIWPIIAKYVYWKRSTFRAYDVFFGDDKCIVSYTPQEEAYKRIVERIDREVANMLAMFSLRNGNISFHQRNLQEALAAYNKSLDHVPNYVPALFKKGIVLGELGRSEEAIDCLEKVVSLDVQIQQKGKDSVNSGNRLTTFENTYYKGRALLELKRFQEAHVVFQAIYQNETSSIDETQRKDIAEAYCGEGDVFLIEGDRSRSATSYTLALASYQRAKELDPTHVVYPTRIGETHLRLGNRLHSEYCYERALEIYQHIIDLFPDYAPAYVGQGNALFHLQKQEDALIAYEKALQLDQYEIQAHGEKGYILLELNNPQEALRAFEKALHLDKNNARYHYGKGQAQSLLGSHQEALYSYNKARDGGAMLVDVSCADAFLELGDAEDRSGRQSQANLYYNNAFGLYESALRRGEVKEEDIYCGLGRVYFSFSDWNHALIYYQKAVEIAPCNAEAYLGMGKVFVELGNSEDAFACLNSARENCNHSASKIKEVDLQNAYGYAHYRLAGKAGSKEYYEHQEKALAHYKEAARACENVPSYIGLGKTYQVFHYNREAIDAFNHALELNPQLADCYYNKGKCYYELEQPSDAYAMYQTAIACGLDNADVRNAQGNALLAMKQYIEAEKAFDYVIKNLKEGVAQAYCGKGVALHRLEMHEDALQAFGDANMLDSFICSQSPYRLVLQDIKSIIERNLYNSNRNTSNLKQKGDVLLLLGEQIDEAVSIYTEVIRHGGASATVYYCRGEAYRLLHKDRKALRDYQKALDIDPHHLYAQKKQKEVEDISVQRLDWPMKKLTFWQIDY